jgi:hypothetical protein
MLIYLKKLNLIKVLKYFFIKAFSNPKLVNL